MYQPTLGALPVDWIPTPIQPSNKQTAATVPTGPVPTVTPAPTTGPAAARMTALSSTTTPTATQLPKSPVHAPTGPVVNVAPWISTPPPATADARLTVDPSIAIPNVTAPITGSIRQRPGASMPPNWSVVTKTVAGTAQAPITNIYQNPSSKDVTDLPSLNLLTPTNTGIGGPSLKPAPTSSASVLHTNAQTPGSTLPSMPSTTTTDTGTATADIGGLPTGKILLYGAIALGAYFLLKGGKR